MNALRLQCRIRYMHYKMYHTTYIFITVSSLSQNAIIATLSRPEEVTSFSTSTNKLSLTLIYNCYYYIVCSDLNMIIIYHKIH